MIKKVSFSLGSGFVTLLTDLAREKLLYGCSPKSAVEVISESLIGCSESVAIDIITGKKLLKTSDDGTDVTVFDTDNVFDFEEFYENVLGNIASDAAEWNGVLDDLNERISENDGTLTLKIPAYVIARYASGESDYGLYDLDDGADDENDGMIAMTIKDAVGAVNALVEKWTGYRKCVAWLRSVDPDILPEGFETMPEALVMLTMKIRALMTKTEYIKEPEFNYLSRDFGEYTFAGPCDITEDYDAGWLAPDGIFYGARGDVADLLHVQIADGLKAAGLIPEPSEDAFPYARTQYDNNPDGYLGMTGWIKIHHQNVLFMGLVQDIDDVKRYDITDVQREQLIRYGNACWDGFLSLGFRHDLKPTSFLKAVEPLMLRKIFEY